MNGCEEIFNGTDVSKNGLTVEFKKIGAFQYATISHSQSGKKLYKLDTPIKGQKEVLARLQNIGKQYNFNMPESQIIKMPVSLTKPLWQEFMALKTAVSKK